MARLRQLAVLILALVAPTLVEAQGADPYTVDDINVDLTRETSAIARQQAIEQGHVQAFGHLLRRLTLPQDHGRLPKVTYAMAADHASGLRIADEATSATRYAAKLAITFDPPKQNQPSERFRRCGRCLGSRTVQSF